MRVAAAVLAAALAAAGSPPTPAAPVPVRFEEGVTHGFLLLRGENGSVIAEGELLQTSRGADVEKRMTFHFHDGSLYDERVRYRAKEVFALQRFELTQRGPAFKTATEIALDESGAYRVRMSRPGKKDEALDGRIDLPEDVCNGLIFVVLKSIPRGGARTVHYVAFQPKPRVIELRMESAGTQQIAIGERARTATRYVLKPHLKPLLALAAAITGRTPPDFHAWFLTDDVPAFVGFEGPLETDGPIWRIEMDAPRLPVSASRTPE